MIKPDGVQRGLIGKIVERFEAKGCKLKGLKLMKPDRKLLEEHYTDLKHKAFFPSLIEYMSSGPLVAMVTKFYIVCSSCRWGTLYCNLNCYLIYAYFLLLISLSQVWEGKDIIKTGRALLGATNPIESLPGTIRGDFAQDVGRNVCHGSDSPKAAEREIGLWFKEGLLDYTPHDSQWLFE